MAISDFALVSLSELKAFLGLADDDADRDAWLESEIDQTTSQLERFLDRRVRARLYHEDLDDDHETNALYLENTPIVEVRNLYRDTDRKFDTDARIADTEYSVFDDRVELISPSSYRYGYGYGYGNGYGGSYGLSTLRRTVRVEYVAGWASVQIPFDRQRIDLREESSGDTLNFTLAAGIYTPAELVSTLQIELTTAGDNARTVSFDWKSRAFTIAQEDGDLTLITSESGVFDDTDSALPLLGFLNANTYDSSPATGGTITLDIPNDLKRVAFDLIATRFDNHAYSDNPRRGVKSRTIGSYTESFTGATATEAMMAYPEQIQSILTQYRRWTDCVI